MSLHDDLDNMMDLAKMAMSDKKEENRRKEKARRTFELVCPYCGGIRRYVWEEGSLPTCPNCGATFDAEDEQLKRIREEWRQEADTERRVYEAQAIESAKTKKKIRRYIMIAVIIIVALIAAVIVAKLNGGSLKLDGSFNFHVS